MILTTDETFRELKHQVSRNNYFQRENKDLRQIQKSLSARIKELEKIVASYERIEEMKQLVAHQQRIDEERQEKLCLI